MKNPCRECKFYHEENNTCQSKKCATGKSGYVTWFDKIFCEPCKDEQTGVENYNGDELHGL